jgi:3',5'-cyclic AMP phosphodiesterase CpdA
MILLLLLTQWFSALSAVEPHTTFAVIGDTHFGDYCPTGDCDEIAYQLLTQINSHGPDFVIHLGDWILNSNEESWVDFPAFLASSAAPMALVLGNHEGSSAPGGLFQDPENHFYPAVEYMPLGRRYYAFQYKGIQIIVVNNNSDTRDHTLYPDCQVPNDSLNHFRSTQRRWLQKQLAKPAQWRIVCGHRTYYGVENFPYRRNILFSEDRAETLRTGQVSLLRDLEQANVRLVLSGDQHCYSRTYPIHRNERDDDRGIVYIVGGGGGGEMDRADPFPDFGKVPEGTLAAAFDDMHFYLLCRVFQKKMIITVHELGTDAVLDEVILSRSPPGP